MRAAAAVCLLVVVAGCTGVLLGDDPAGGNDVDTPTEGALEVHLINVGQGAAMLVVSPTGETLLVDSGNYEDDGEYVLEYLRARGIDRIDYLVTSHAHADHIGGHAAVIDHFETDGEGVGAVYDPGIAASTQTYEEYLDAVERHDVPLYRTAAGDGIPLAGADLRVLGPPEDHLAGGDRNENSIVLRIEYGDASVLFAGDAEKRAERSLVDRYGDGLASTVLVAGHHGSATSTHGFFLDHVDPEAVVVSSAYDSEYGHPHESVLGRLAARSLPTYWTGTHGDVAFVTDGRTVTVRTQRAAPTDPRRLENGSRTDPDIDDALESRGTLGDGDPTTLTPTSTPAVTDGGTSVGTDTGAADALAVVEVHADAAGDDRENLNDEYVVFGNTGNATIDLSGWEVRDEAGKRYASPEGTSLAPGETVTLHTGDGTDRDGHRYWGAGGPVWNNGGDTVIVEVPNGTEVLRQQYD
ncbi:competence protein [Halobacteriales archaeon QS_5_70_17]|nr:MAG: competence protein [Halobacteriales archaeon QS_5_70_17]